MATTASTTPSGVLDVPSLVTQLMAVERRPIDRLNAQVTSYQTRISSWGTISGLISGFQSALQNVDRNLAGYTATPSDTSIFTAVADSTAVAGSYSLNITSLAQAQSLVAAGQASSSTAIGTGTATTITFDFGTINGVGFANGKYDTGTTFTSSGTTKSIVIDGTNNTLQGIRDAINSANIGITATIVNDGSATPYRLVLTSNSTGAANSVKITTDGADASIDALLANDPTNPAGQNLTEAVTARNASLTVNGIPVTSASNTVSGAIQGVTLTLKNTTPATASLSVARDTTAITTALSSFVDAYNALASQLKSHSAWGSATVARGDMAGDGTIRQLQEQMRDIFTTAASGGTLTYLAQIGVAFQADGTLKLDNSKLLPALTGNFSDVSNLLSGATGFSTRLQAWTQSVLKPGIGLISIATKGLNDGIKRYNDQINQLEARMEVLQRQYTSTYSNLNALLSSMNNLSTYLSQQSTSKGSSS